MIDLGVFGKARLVLSLRTATIVIANNSQWVDNFFESGGGLCLLNSFALYLD